MAVQANKIPGPAVFDSRDNFSFIVDNHHEKIFNITKILYNETKLKIR